MKAAAPPGERGRETGWVRSDQAVAEARALNSSTFVLRL